MNKSAKFAVERGTTRTRVAGLCSLDIMDEDDVHFCGEAGYDVAVSSLS